MRAANGDRYHACNCRVFLDEKQVKALKIAARKQKNKAGLIHLIRFLFSNYQNGLLPTLSPSRAASYLNFVYEQKLAREYGVDDIAALYNPYAHPDLFEIRTKIYETWHTELWQRGLMGDISGRACDAIVDELLDTEEYWELSLHEKYQKIGQLFPKKRTPILEKIVTKSELQKEPEPCLFLPEELIPTVV